MSASALYEVAAASGPVSSDLENLKVHPTGLRETIRIVCEAHTSAKKPLPRCRVNSSTKTGIGPSRKTSQPSTIERRSRKRRNFWIVKTWQLWDGERLVGRSDHDRPWTE